MELSGTSGTASGLLERPARLLRPLYCSLAGRNSSLYYLRPIIPWTALRPFGTEPWLYLERPPGYWNARSANGTIWNFGTALGLLEQSLWLYLERAKRLWNGRKALAALVLFVGRRYYLRPISYGTREALLERLQPLERRRLLACSLAPLLITATI